MWYVFDDQIIIVRIIVTFLIAVDNCVGKEFPGAQVFDVLYYTQPFNKSKSPICFGDDVLNHSNNLSWCTHLANVYTMRDC